MRRPVIISLAVVAIPLACSDEVGIEDVRPAKVGAVQPAGDGTPVDEMEACTALLDALTQKAEQLNCAKPQGKCPELIRPAGGDACSQYDNGTVVACIDHIHGYGSCSAFETSPCIVSTVEGSMSPGCVPPTPDAGPDGAADATPDVVADALQEVSADGQADVVAESRPDVVADGRVESGVDGRVDAGVDSSTDGGGESGTDAGDAGGG